MNNKQTSDDDFDFSTLIYDTFPASYSVTATNKKTGRSGHGSGAYEKDAKLRALANYERLHK